MTPQHPTTQTANRRLPLPLVTGQVAEGGRDCARDRMAAATPSVPAHTHAEYVSEAELQEFSMIVHRALLAIDTYIQARYNLKRATCPHCGGSLLDRGEGT